MTIHLKDFPSTMFQQCFSHSLVELSITLASWRIEGVDDSYDYSAVSKAIEKMPHLKKLELATYERWDIRIKSKSLEELRCSSEYNDVAECSLPSLKLLDIHIPAMEWLILMIAHRLCKKYT